MTALPRSMFEIDERSDSPVIAQSMRKQKIARASAGSEYIPVCGSAYDPGKAVAGRTTEYDEVFYRRQMSDRRFISPEGRIHWMQDALFTQTVEGRFGR